jgi:hypothetical protein
METNETKTKIKFNEIQIGQLFRQVGNGGRPMDCLIRKTRDCIENKAGRGELVTDPDFPKNIGREITVPQNRNCFLIALK